MTSQDNVKMVDTLIKNGADINATDSSGKNALLVAAEKG